MQQAKSRRNYVADAEKLRYSFLPSANVQILTIGKMEPDQCSMNEKSEYTSLDEPIKTGILVA